MDLVFKALSDPTRRHILRLLRSGERSAGQLAEAFAISGPSMSHHFNVLKQADLVAVRREGQQLIYTLNTSVVDDVVAVLMDIFVSDNHSTENRANDGSAADHKPFDENPGAVTKGGDR